MADVGDDLLDGDLEETGFGELDGEEEDALLADDDYDSYQNSMQPGFIDPSQGERHSEILPIGDHVQDVCEGDEIIEDAEEDVLELAVVDELDESELDNGQGYNKESSVGVTSSTSNNDILGAESDEEERDSDRRSRFKSERTNIISLKGVSSSKSIDIPDTLDKVKTVPPVKLQPRGGMQHRGRGNIRGRLGPIHRGGPMMMRRGFPMRRPNMMPPPHRPPHPSHKIHINPHFRGGVQQPHGDWDNGRLPPPPPGCESFKPPPGPHQRNWGAPPPYHGGMGQPFPPNAPHPPPQFQPAPQMYPEPQQQQGYEDPYHSTMESPQPNMPNRFVQFSENSQLITVENQHFQQAPFDQNFDQANNQYQIPQNVPPQYNNHVYPNQFQNNIVGPNVQSQPFPQNVGSYPPHEFHHPQNATQFSNYDNQNSWNQPMDQQTSMYPQNHQQNPLQPPHVFPGPQPMHPQFRQPFNNRFKSPQQRTYPGGMRGKGMKRLPQMSSNTSSIPTKQTKFEQNKQKTPIRTNLQEIKTVDNLPDTTTAQEPEPEVEEDEETKQYRLKIAEQKALREKILKEKEARRLASIIEKQKNQESQITSVQDESTPQQQLQSKPQPKPQPKPQSKPQPKPQPRAQFKPQPKQGRSQSSQLSRGAGRGAVNSANRVISRQPQRHYSQTPAPGVPVVQIQQMLGTMYKIVKVRTKEGAIVTRKTPLVMDETNSTMTPMRTVTTASQPQRRIVLNAPGQPTVRMPNNVGGGDSMVQRAGSNSIRMILANGRTLFAVKTLPQSNTLKPTQRVVIDNRPQTSNPAMKVATTPILPVSTLVTINNLSLSTSQHQIQKLAKQVGRLVSFKHEPELKRASLQFQKASEAEQFYLKFHRKMIDLSRISVTIVPE